MLLGKGIGSMKILCLFVLITSIFLFIGNGKDFVDAETDFDKMIIIFLSFYELSIATIALNQLYLL